MWVHVVRATSSRYSSPSYSYAISRLCLHHMHSSQYLLKLHSLHYLMLSVIVISSVFSNKSWSKRRVTYVSYTEYVQWSTRRGSQTSISNDRKCPLTALVMFHQVSGIWTSFRHVARSENQVSLHLALVYRLQWPNWSRQCPSQHSQA